MNSRRPRSTNHATPFSPIRSIGVTVGSGILVTSIILTAISITALLGFYSFQKVLHDFSEKTFPLTTQEAQSSIMTSQLLQQINLLQINNLLVFTPTSIGFYATGNSTWRVFEEVS